MTKETFKKQYNTLYETSNKTKRKRPRQGRIDKQKQMAERTNKNKQTVFVAVVF